MLLTLSGRVDTLCSCLELSRISTQTICVNSGFGPKSRDVGGAEAIPQLVRTDNKGFKAVSYDKLAVVAIEAIKELKSQNDALRAVVEKRGRQIEALSTAHATRH